jgi:hypothetical protein
LRMTRASGVSSAAGQTNKQTGTQDNSTNKRTNKQTARQNNTQGLGSSSNDRLMHVSSDNADERRRDGAHPTLGAGWGSPHFGVRDGAHPTLGAGWGSPHFGCGMGLTPLWVRDADDSHVEHIRVRAKHRLRRTPMHRGPMNAHTHPHAIHTHSQANTHAPIRHANAHGAHNTDANTNTQAHTRQAQTAEAYLGRTGKPRHACDTPTQTHARTPTHPRRPRACLDVGGEDVEAAREDHVLLAVADVQEAVGVLNIDSSATSGSTLKIASARLYPAHISPAGIAPRCRPA